MCYFQLWHLGIECCSQFSDLVNKNFYTEAVSFQENTSWFYPELLILLCVCLQTVQFSSVAQSCLTLCNPIECSTPGLPVHHQLSEVTQTHAHWVGDAIQPSHTLSSPSPPSFYLSQHQGLFKWVSSLLQVVKLLKFWLQHQSFQWTLMTDFLLDGLVGSPCSPRDSQESYPTPQFKSINSSGLSFLFMTIGKP